MKSLKPFCDKGSHHSEPNEFHSDSYTSPGVPGDLDTTPRNREMPPKPGLDQSEWRDDPQSIADWIAWADTIEPMLMSDEERAEMERYRAEQRRFNIEAVRKQMLLRDEA